jgi:hypothetical protein
MLKEKTDDFNATNITIDAYNYEKTKVSSSNLYAQECIDQNWITVSNSNNNYVNLPISIDDLSSGETSKIDFRMSIPASGVSTSGDFFGYLRLRYKGSRTKVFIKSSDTYIGPLYDDCKFDSGVIYK